MTTVVSGNRTVETTKTYESSASLEQYLSENLIKASVGFLTLFGLLAIYAYHFGIEYSPVFDLGSTGSLIFAVAYTGLALLVFMCLSILVPAFLISTAIVEHKKLGSAANLPKMIGISFLIAFVVFLVFCVCLAYIDATHWRWYWLCLGVVLLGGVIHGVLKGLDLWASAEQSVLLTMACLLQFLPIVLYVSILNQPSHNGVQQEFDAVRFFANTVWIDLFIQVVGGYFVAAWVSPGIKRNHRVLSIVAAALVVFFITLVAGNPGFIFGRIANMTKFGNFYATELSLSKDGCKTVNARGTQFCSGTEEIGYKACGALIVSRIGAESYIKLYEPTTDAARNADPGIAKTLFTRSVYLPSKEVVGMHVYDVMGIVSPNDPVMIARVAACRVANQQSARTLITLRGEEYFAFDKADLSAAGQRTLTRIAEQLRPLKNDTWTVNVHGYTDQIGNAKHNLALSAARAAAVAAFLQSRLPAELGKRIVPKGAGSSNLKKTEAQCPATMDREKRIDCLSDNRRTEIEIVSPPAAGDTGGSAAQPAQAGSAPAPARP